MVWRMGLWSLDSYPCHHDYSSYFSKGPLSSSLTATFKYPSAPYNDPEVLIHVTNTLKDFTLLQPTLSSFVWS